MGALFLCLVIPANMVYNGAMKGGTMPRFSVNLPTELDTWLQAQADDQQRTKNAQLVYLLELARGRQPRRVEFACGDDAPCCPDRHNFGSSTPMENEGCNCGKVRW